MKTCAFRESYCRVNAFMKTHGLSRKSFFDGISETRKRELLKQLKAVWTHDCKKASNFIRHGAFAADLV